MQGLQKRKQLILFYKVLNCKLYTILQIFTKYIKKWINKILLLNKKTFRWQRTRRTAENKFENKHLIHSLATRHRKNTCLEKQWYNVLNIGYVSYLRTYGFSIIIEIDLCKFVPFVKMSSDRIGNWIWENVIMKNRHESLLPGI